MKLSISRETLLKNLRYMQAVVEKRTSIAILSNVRLRAEGNALEMTATDNDITVQGATESFVEQGGITTVNAHKLFEIISKIPEGVMVGMDLATDGNRMTIEAGKSKFSLACLSAEAFPDMTRLDNGTTFEIAGDDLKRLLVKAGFATSSDDTRQYLSGIYFHVAEEDGNKLLRAAATDGHRLAQVSMPLPEGCEEMPGVILPRKTIAELKKLSDEAEVIKLSIADKKIQAEAGEITLTSKVIDGTFPDYTKVIPQGNDIEMDVSRRQLMQAVDRVSILAHEKSRSIKFDVKPNNLFISANNPDQENASEEVKVEYDKEDMSIGFNAKYVSEIGGQIEGDDIQFMFRDENSPVIIKDPSDAGALFVVMPMRI